MVENEFFFKKTIQKLPLRVYTHESNFNPIKMKNERKGYSEEFLGKSHPLPLPKIDLEYEKQILENPTFRENHIVDYVHYSLVMNARTRQAFYSAANVDLKKLNEKVSARNWFIDSRVGEENQVGPEAYDRNEWDRGHLTRRADITWGNEYEAKMGSNDSCSYANACMQHENFNQDEWTVPEEVILNLDKAAGGKVCVFTGPVFTKIDRWYNRSGLGEPVRIPETDFGTFLTRGLKAWVISLVFSIPSMIFQIPRAE